MTGPASWREVAARAASLLLRYPDPSVLAALPLVRAALAELPAQVSGPLSAVAEHRATTPPTALASSYVDSFDFRRRCCLYLTYYTCGDTRQRGEALVGFAAAYRHAGLTVVDGELPDYLPAVLDLAATAPDVGWRLLREHRVGLDLLSAALTKENSPYRHVVQAALSLLPPAGPGEVAAAARLARSGPPQETVGLEPFALAPTPGGRR